MDVIVERVAGLDVHKTQVTACVRLPGADGGRVEEVAQFRTTVAGLLVLRDWLAAHAVTQVVMEATEAPWEIWRLPNQARRAWGKENPLPCQPPRSIPMS